MKKWPTEIWIIVWEDPTTYTTWISRKKAKTKKPALVTSVGWGLIDEGDNIRIVMDWSSDGDAVGTGVIPKRTVVRRFRVPVPKVMGKFLKRFLVP